MEWNPHTRIKLKLLEKYFDICFHYHENSLKRFYYVDTHAGDGYAEFKNEKVLGSSLLAVERGFQCFLIEKEKDKFEKLQENIGNFPKKDREGYRQEIELFNDDCNAIIEEILKKIPPYHHSLFFLDPYAPKDLMWETILRIVKHEYKFKDPRDMPVRRPELIINFPISGIKRIAGKLKDEDRDPRKKKTVENITNFFGGPRWKSIWEKYEMDKEKGIANSEHSRDALKNLFIRKFEEYYQYFHTVLVTEFQSNLPLYYLIYFTNKPLGDNKMRNVVNDIEIWKKTAYIHEVYNIIPLDEYCKVQDIDDSIQKSLEEWPIT